jgi:hypothetical protein
LFPREIANLGNSQTLGFLETFDRLQRSLGCHGMKKEVEVRSQDMKVFRIKHIDTKSEYDRNVQPPKGPKKDMAIFF